MIDIFELVTPPGVVAKLGSKHGLSMIDIEDALERPYRAVWLSEPPRILLKAASPTDVR